MKNFGFGAQFAVTSIIPKIHKLFLRGHLPLLFYKNIDAYSYNNLKSMMRAEVFFYCASFINKLVKKSLGLGFISVYLPTRDLTNIKKLQYVMTFGSKNDSQMTLLELSSYFLSKF